MTTRERKLFKIVVRGILFKNSTTFDEWIAALDELLPPVNSAATPEPK